MYNTPFFSESDTMNKSVIMAGIYSLILPSICYATLGESVTSIQQDNQSLAAQISHVTTQVTPNFTTSVITTKKGIIKEYSAQNKVFAVTWTGKAYPNFRQIFGASFNQLSKAKQIPNQMGYFKLVGDDFIMQMNGANNLLSGIAYIPSLIPTNLTISDLH